MGKTVLTVDDSATVRSMLDRALAEAGHTVLQACDGIEGLELLEAHQPDLVITDINMPRLDGYGFIERLRSEGRNRGLPVLVLTTESDEASKDRARKAGATGWIVKPFDPQRLLDAVRRVCGA